MPRRAGEKMTVGRESPSDVKLGIGTVSGTHASFEMDADSALRVQPIDQLDRRSSPAFTKASKRATGISPACVAR